MSSLKLTVSTTVVLPKQQMSLVGQTGYACCWTLTTAAGNWR